MLAGGHCACTPGRGNFGAFSPPSCSMWQRFSPVTLYSYFTEVLYPHTRLLIILGMWDAAQRSLPEEVMNTDETIREEIKGVD